MQQTSLFAYRSIENIGAKQQAVLSTISKLGEACNLDIAQELGWDINRVTPRNFELVKMGLVVESKRDICRTGRKVIYWKVNTN